MAKLEIDQPGMTTYRAPDGYVFDYKEPQFAVIKELDGSMTTIPHHLYANQLSLGRFDSLDRYTLVEDPRAKRSE